MKKNFLYIIIYLYIYNYIIVWEHGATKCGGFKYVSESSTLCSDPTWLWNGWLNQPGHCCHAVWGDGNPIYGAPSLSHGRDLVSASETADWIDLLIWMSWWSRTGWRRTLAERNLVMPRTVSESSDCCSMRWRWERCQHQNGKEQEVHTAWKSYVLVRPRNRK